MKVKVTKQDLNTSLRRLAKEGMLSCNCIVSVALKRALKLHSVSYAGAGKVAWGRSRPAIHSADKYLTVLGADPVAGKFDRCITSTGRVTSLDKFEELKNSLPVEIEVEVQDR